VPVRVIFKPSAEKEFRKLPREQQRSVAAKVDVLVRDPQAAGEEPLKGARSLFRIRAGDLRGAYLRQPGLISVVKIGNRREVYDELRRAGYFK